MMSGNGTGALMRKRTLNPEDQIARYRVIGPLGAGGMGEVYLAKDQALERSVALKVLPPELVRDEDRVRRFVLEAKSASSLGPRRPPAESVNSALLLDDGPSWRHSRRSRVTAARSPSNSARG